jgi:hypothetical protein
VKIKYLIKYHHEHDVVWKTVTLCLGYRQFRWKGSEPNKDLIARTSGIVG